MSQPEAVVTAAILVFLGGVLGWIVRGLGVLAHRKITNAPRQENASYLNSVADLLGKMKDQGLTITDVQDLGSVLNTKTKANSPAAKEVVDAGRHDNPSHPAYDNNLAMQGRTHAAYAVAEAQLEQVILDAALIMSEAERESLDETQAKWREYRSGLETCAYKEYEGGTHAPLASVFAGLTETERRTAELREQVRERSGRTS